MADNYLITGYWGVNHITPENDRGINAAMFGKDKFILPIGEQFKAEYIGNNTVRINNGKLMNNGAAAGIPVGQSIDLLIANAGQGLNRNDLIVFQYTKDVSTQIERGEFVVVKGEETEGEPVDPALHEENLLTDTATLDQMPLYRIRVSGTEISEPESVFAIYNDFFDVSGHNLEKYTVANAAEFDDKISEIESKMDVCTKNVCIISQSQWEITSPSGDYFVEINKAWHGYASVEVRATIDNNCVIMRRVLNAGSWGEWEHENPPMQLNHTYPTTERFNGKTVYTRLASFTTTKEPTTLTYSQDSYDTVIKYACTIDGLACPADTTDGYKFVVYVSKTNNKLIISNWCDLSTGAGKTALVQVWFTLNE